MHRAENATPPKSYVPILNRMNVKPESASAPAPSRVETAVDEFPEPQLIVAKLEAVADRPVVVGISTAKTNRLFVQPGSRPGTVSE